MFDRKGISMKKQTAGRDAIGTFALAKEVWMDKILWEYNTSL